jgi:hypothetical protein
LEIDYDSGPKVPKSYEGVSGGALWELHTELNGTNVVDVQKKLVGVAFRQTRASDQHLITCNGIQSISAISFQNVGLAKGGCVAVRMGVAFLKAIGRGTWSSLLNRALPLALSATPGLGLQYL